MPANSDYGYAALPTDSNSPPLHDPAPIAASRLWRLAHTIYTSTRELLRDNYGLLLIAASQVCFALVNVAVKKLSSIEPPVPIMELILIRMGITGVVSLGLMHYSSIESPFLGPKGVRLLLLARGFGGFLSILGIYSALQWISLSDVTVLGFLVPLTTAMAGCIFLKEKFSKSQAIAGVLSLVGVILIARPAALFGRVPETTREEEGANAEPEESLPSAEANPSDHLRLLAVLFSLIGVLGSTVALICTRAVGKRAHAMHSLVAFSSQSVIAAAFGMIITRTPLVFPTEWRWGLLLLDIGVMGFIAQLLLNMGLQHEQAGRGTMALYTQVVWTYILEKLYFQTTPSMMSIVGAVIIVGAAVYVALTKEKTPEEEGQEVMQGVTVALERFDHDEEVLEEGAKDEGGGTEVAKNYSEGP